MSVMNSRNCFTSLTKVPEAAPRINERQSYLVQLCAPIPRFLWPGKPSLETGIMIAELRGEVDSRTGQATYTRSPDFSAKCI